MTANPDEFPQDPSEQLDQHQAEDTLVDRGVDDALDEGFSPPERWSPAEKYGNTPAEERAGETLDQRLEQEEPDVGADLFDDAEQLDDGEVGRARAGRLVDPDEGIGQDYEAELVGSDVGVDGAGASAEEAAVHIVDEYDEEG